MKKLLSLDSPIIHFMEHVADFFILNALTIFCSIPLITVGAALAAHCKVMQNLVLNEEQPVVKAYFRAFKDNFKQATAVWLFTALFIVLFAVDYFAVYIYLGKDWAQLICALLGILGAVALGVVCYALALMARYENTIKEHLRNGFVLAIGNLPRTVLLVLLTCLPLILALISIELLFYSMLLWFTFGISLIIYIQALVLKPVILSLDPEDTDNGETEG